MSDNANVPVFLAELELTEPIHDIPLPARPDGSYYKAVRVFVRMQRIPVGHVNLNVNALDADSVRLATWRQLSSAINARRQSSGLCAIDIIPASGIPEESALASEVEKRPAVTIVVCTRNRPESLTATLRSIADMHYSPFEVVVVDNAPDTDRTFKLFDEQFGKDSRFRYVREPRIGLSRARNRGVAEASSEIVAFTDDDTKVDPWWLLGIVRGFERADDVGCVTGLIRTASLESIAQLYFDRRQAWESLCEPRVFDLRENRDDSPLYPYSAGIFGAGANFAVTRSLVEELGGFDEALGAGMPCGGGEDLDLFMRTVLTGHRLVHEPSAVVSHFHRAELSQLSRQMRSYGSGCTAALTAVMLKTPKARLELIPKAVVGSVRVLTIGKRTRSEPLLPSGMIREEFIGMALGPWQYLKGRRCAVSRAVRFLTE